jgi:hypothetical protein
VQDALSDSPSARDTWRYTCELAAAPRNAARARAFVCHHLIEHRLLHLVDIVRLVASELAIDAAAHARTPSTFTLSRSGSVLLLLLTDGSASAPARRPLPGEQALGQGARGLGALDALDVEWGIVTAPGRNTTIWSRFDARPRGRLVNGRAASTAAL